MKSGLPSSQAQQLEKTAKDSRLNRGRFIESLFQVTQLPLMSIDGSSVPGGLDPFVIVASRQQAMNVNGRNAFNGQEDGVSAQEAFDHHGVDSGRVTGLEGIDETDICLLYTSPSPRD